MISIHSRVVLCAVACASIAGAQTPHLDGRVTVNPAKGTLRGEMCTSKFAPRNDLRFLLNTALTVRSVSDGAGHTQAFVPADGGRNLSDTHAYVVRQDNPLRTFCVSYDGTIPTYERNTAEQDWKGQITVMQGTMRAAEQTRWYPTVFDSTSDRDDESVSYRLSVSCASCRSIYVNGARPVRDTAGVFESSTPRDLLLLAGAFDFAESDQMTFVAGAAGPDARSVFSGAVHDISAYYESLLGVRYRDRPVMLTFTSISRDRHPGIAEWQFVTWPTIAMSGGIAFDSVLVRDGGPLRLSDGLWTTLSHEMGHYYFGTVMVPAGPLRWFALESMAEFLSLKAVYAGHGEIAGVTRLLTLVGNMGTTTLPALDKITEADSISPQYRYQYAPVFLHVLERRAGDAKVAQLLRNLLADGASGSLDFNRLARASEAAGIPRAMLTDGWDVDVLRRDALTEAATVMSTAMNDRAQTAGALALAAAIVNADTTTSGRLAVLQSLRRLLVRDSSLTAAYYQIGKIGALTGRELDVAQASLEYYVMHPAPKDGPSHASAYWRIGMIEERRGHPDKARAAYMAALEREPNNASAKGALKLLDAERKTP